jgi:transcriptional regulator GlxA family with amidase domain
LYEGRWSRARGGGEDTREVARAHAGAPRQRPHRKVGVQVVTDLLDKRRERGAADARVSLGASTPGRKRTDSGMVIEAEVALRDAPAPDVVVVPGTGRPQSPLGDAPLLEWLAAVHPRTAWTGAVCTGSLVLGAAGLLQGRRATTHWLALEALRGFGVEPVAERVVFDGRIVTAAGVSSGIDMALALAGRIAGEDVAQVIQLAIEYDPQPPFDAGAPTKVTPRVLAQATALLQAPL